MVVISNRDDEFSIDAVALNNQKPGILMARHLLELGHRDVAFIAPPLTARQHQRQKRVGGFLMEFEKAGLSDHVLVRSAADSKDMALLREVTARLHAAGYTVGNLDCTVLAQAPKLAPHIAIPPAAPPPAIWQTLISVCCCKTRA